LGNLVAVEWNVTWAGELSEESSLSEEDVFCTSLGLDNNSSSLGALDRVSGAGKDFLGHL
jgi:hypothetical protein